MRYFGYCTLLDEDEMKRLCPSSKPVGVGRLSGYRLRFSAFDAEPEQGSCDLEDAPGHVMWGLIWEMDPAEYDALDVMAGVDRGHLVRIDVEVATDDHGTVEATTYRNPTPAGPFSPTAAYTRPVLAGARQLGLPGAYVEELEAIVAAHA